MPAAERVYTFFSVHERLFQPVHRLLRERYGVHGFAGTVWGQDQASFLAEGDIDYHPLVIFTRDVLHPSQTSDGQAHLGTKHLGHRVGHVEEQGGLPPRAPPTHGLSPHG